MSEIEVKELEGAELNYWVAKAIGMDTHIEGGRFVVRRGNGRFGVPSYSADWSQGGPLIEQHNVQLIPPTSRVHRNYGFGDERNGWYPSEHWSATAWTNGPDGKRPVYWHETSALVAAMRCIVAAKFGATVSADN